MDGPRWVTRHFHQIVIQNRVRDLNVYHLPAFTPKRKVSPHRTQVYRRTQFRSSLHSQGGKNVLRNSMQLVGPHGVAPLTTHMHGCDPHVSRRPAPCKHGRGPPRRREAGRDRRTRRKRRSDRLETGLAEQVSSPSRVTPVSRKTKYIQSDFLFNIFPLFRKLHPSGRVARTHTHTHP